MHSLCLFASHGLDKGCTVSSSTVQGAVLCIGFWPGAGKTAVFTHMQLLTTLTISVAGRLPMHLGKMRFKGAALGKCFPTGSAAEWADPCTNRRRGRGQTGRRPPDQSSLILPFMSIFPFLLQVLQTPPLTSDHLQPLPSADMGQTPVFSSSSPRCSFPWGEG